MASLLRSRRRYTRTDTNTRTTLREHAMIRDVPMQWELHESRVNVARKNLCANIGITPKILINL